MSSISRRLAVAALYTLGFWPLPLSAQDDDPLAGELGEPEQPAAGEAPAEGPAEEPAPQPAPAAAPAETEAPGASAEAPGSGAATGSVDLSAAAAAASTQTDAETPAPPPAARLAVSPLVTGSHIRRPWIMVEGAPVITSPLRTELQGRDYLQLRRQLGGIALPDTAAVLGLGMPGTSFQILRFQPTLVLLNGRRLVSMPYFGPRGSDIVDLNQLPIPLVDRIETSYGIAAGLYGEDAIGGVMNVVTRRDFDAFEVELGGQVTDKFDQHEMDISLTAGMGSQRTGVTGMASYFNRQPLAATDRDWLTDGSREDRTEALLGFPAAFQQLTNWDYPIADPNCKLAARQGQSNGYEVRLKGYGPPSNFDKLNMMTQARLLGNHDMSRGAAFGTVDGEIGELETTTYCAQNYLANQDLILKDERIQSYLTAWHALTDHTEAFAEVGYYRSENVQRTAPAFPVLRSSVDFLDNQPVWLPGKQMLVPSDLFDKQHADIPYLEPGFATAEVPDPAGRIANNLFLVGRTQGPFHGDGESSRRLDVMRGVLGVQGDLKGVGAGSVIESWDWDIAGTYTTTESLSRTQDTLLDKLAEALAKCPRSKADPSRADMDMDQLVDQIPTTIKERQEMGCFNPFYSSVLNNAALDPLNESSANPANSNGFVTTDTDDDPLSPGFGVQDGGYICDPNDPDKPCPAGFDEKYAGTVNTKQVIDRITGEHTAYTRRTLALADANLRGNIATFDRGGLGFGLGAELRRETLLVDYDQAYNQKLYGFLSGGPDIDPLGRNVVMEYAELGLRVLDGLLDIQPAASLEHYEGVGTGVNWLAGLSFRPLAAVASPPAALEWLLIRGHIGQAKRAPSLVQQAGTMNEFVTVDYRGSTLFIPHQISGSPDLDFETYTTVSGGIQWDFAGVHVGADFWTTQIDDLIAADNARTLVDDCWGTYQLGAPRCYELAVRPQTQALDHLRSSFDNLANVSTNGADGAIMYTLDSKRRGLGDFGTFVVGVQGSYLNSYLIDSPRALRHFYRAGEPPEPHDEDGDMLEHALPEVDETNTIANVRDYSTVKAEYEAAGYRNEENFAPPLPKLRFTVPLRYLFLEAHTLGFTMRYLGGYNDDSEYTIEERNLLGIDQVQFAEGEAIPSSVVFDASYGFWFGEEGWKVKLAAGVFNIADTAPPAVQSPLGYEAVGLYDPRGRTIYLRATGEL